MHSAWGGCRVLIRLQRFAAVIMRIREPKTTALIFASGKMVITGAKSEDAVSYTHLTLPTIYSV